MPRPRSYSACSSRIASDGSTSTSTERGGSRDARGALSLCAAGLLAAILTCLLRSATPAVAAHHATQVGDLTRMLRRISTHARQGPPRWPPLPGVRQYWLLQLGRGECSDALYCPLVGSLDIAKQYGPLDAEGSHLRRRIAHAGAFVGHTIPLGPACTHPDLWFATDAGAYVVSPAAQVPHQPGNGIALSRWLIIQLLVS